jgi:ribosomal-protein-alanine N-acetyltransferase
MSSLRSVQSRSAQPVRLEEPSAVHEAAFLAAVKASRPLHRNLVTPPDTRERYRAYVSSGAKDTCANFLVLVAATDEIAGVINIENIVRGYFDSAFLGYYGFTPHVGLGLMRAGLGLVIDHAFRELKLHRLEANIQPSNERSIGVVKSLGFRLEGYSPKYLKISGRWRDHERWALLREEWPSRTAQRPVS